MSYKCAIFGGFRGQNIYKYCVACANLVIDDLENFDPQEVNKSIEAVTDKMTPSKPVEKN